MDHIRRIARPCAGIKHLVIPRPSIPASRVSDLVLDQPLLSITSHELEEIQ
jgi:hypothetical protein